MSATNAMRTRQKARIQEIPDAPISNRALRSIYLACRKFLEQRGIEASDFTSGYRGKARKKRRQLKPR
jgi:hypothetical protein